MLEKESLYIMRENNGGKEYFPSPIDKAVIDTYTYTAQRMGGAPSITAKLMYPRCLDKDWTRKEYVEFNGERYYIRQIPSSTKDNTDTRYKHELTFVSERDVLENIYFLDVVTSDTESQYRDRYRSNTSKVHFYGDINEFVSRLNDSLIYSNLYNKTTGEGYHVVIDEGIYADAKDVNIEDKFIAEALQDIYNIYGLTYYWKGKTCHVGHVENTIDTPVEYGDKDALLSINKGNANYRLINRITGNGGTTNLPYYYPNKDAEGEAIYTVENDDYSEVENVSISLNTIIKYNPDAYTKYAYINIETTSDKLWKAPLYDTKGEEIVEPIRSVKIDLAPGNFIVASKAVRYKIHGYKGSYINSFNNTFNGDYFVVQESGDGIMEGTVNIYLKKWEDKYNVPNEIYNISDVGKKEFEEDTWYEFVIVMNIRCKHTSTPLTARLEMNSGPTYHFIGGKRFSYGDGKEINYDASGITIEMEEHSVKSALQYNVDFRDGDWIRSVQNPDENPLIINITGRRWIQPSQNLMPSIYRESVGAERYYNAINNQYDDGEGGKYTFNNQYTETDPHEGMTTFEDIIPTINGIKNSKGQLIGEIADISFDTDDNDMLKDGKDEYLHPYFYIKLHLYDGEGGFNIFTHALPDDEAAIEMTSGNCSSCRFPIAVDKYAKEDGLSYEFYNPVITDDAGNLKQVSDSTVKPYYGDYIPAARTKESYVDRQQDTSRYEVWIAVKKDTDTFGLIMPNASQGYRPSKGDTFAITGISLPWSYITEAEKRLDAALIAYMKANNDEKFTYSIKFSRIFLAQNEVFATKLNENTSLTVKYNGEEHELYVSNYTSKADDTILTEVTVDLTDTLTTSQSSLQQQLDSVKGEILETVSRGYKELLTPDLKSYLRKDIPDSAQELITFMKGLISVLKSKFNGGAEFGETVDSMLTGKGVLITEDGRIQADNIEVRGSMSVLRLIANEITAMQGDVSFTDTGMIERAEEQPDGSWKLWIEKRTTFDVLNFRKGNVIYSIVNTMPTGGTDYYTSWMRVESTDTAENLIEVSLYADGDVPGGKNYAPQAGFYITRRGDSKIPDDGETNTDAQSWLISSREGRIMFLANVFKPVLEDWNYGVAIGKLPKTAALEQTPVAEGDLGVMADVVIAQRFYEFDGNGKLVTKKVDRGDWSLDVAGGDAPYRYMTHEWQSSAGVNMVTLQQDMVYHSGCKWGCMSDKTLAEPGAGTEWQLVEAVESYGISCSAGSSIRLTAGGLAAQAVKVGFWKRTGNGGREGLTAARVEYGLTGADPARVFPTGFALGVGEVDLTGYLDKYAGLWAVLTVSIYDEAGTLLAEESFGAVRDGDKGDKGAGVNPNLLDDTDFLDEGHLGAWDVVNELHWKAGVEQTDDYAGGVAAGGGVDGANSFGGGTWKTPEEIDYKEILRQAVGSRLTPGAWHTLSFWCRSGMDWIGVDETSALYGFGTRSVMLRAGRRWQFGVNGRRSASAASGGITLRVYIYNEDWSWNKCVELTSEADATVLGQFDDVPATGKYAMTAYAYPNTAGNTAEVTVNSYILQDLDGVLETYIYPGCVDTGEKMLVDGAEVTAGGDGYVALGLNSVWGRHTVTFKAKGSFDAAGQYVLFRLQPSACEGVRAYADLCRPKLETGKEATAYLPSAASMHGDPGKDGESWTLWLETGSVVACTAYGALKGGGLALELRNGAGVAAEGSTLLVTLKDEAGEAILSKSYGTNPADLSADFEQCVVVRGRAPYSITARGLWDGSLKVTADFTVSYETPVPFAREEQSWSAGLTFRNGDLLLDGGKVYMWTYPVSGNSAVAPADDVRENAGTHWRAYEYWSMLATRVLLAEFALVGGAVFMGDYMISRQGTVGLIESEDYTLFDGDDPRDDDLSGSFAPRLYLNFRTGDCNFTRGRIGGFDIGKDSIGGNSGGGRAMTLTKRNIQFTDGGSRKLSAGVTDEALNLKYLLRLDDTSAQGGTPFVNPNIGAFFNVSGNTDGNFAFAGVGSGALNGYVAGYKVNEIRPVDENSVSDIDYLNGDKVFVTALFAGQKIFLPTRDNMSKALFLTNENTPFAVPITVISHCSYETFRLVGNKGAAEGNDEYPLLFRGSDTELSFIEISPGDAVTLMLVFDKARYYAYVTAIVNI